MTTSEEALAAGKRIVAERAAEIEKDAAKEALTLPKSITDIVSAFTKRFFVYDMSKGEHGDHVGAQKTAASFLAESLKEYRMAVLEEVEDAVERAYLSGRLDTRVYRQELLTRLEGLKSKEV